MPSWGDYVEINGPPDGMVPLLAQQIIDSFPHLEGFELAGNYTLGWVLTQGEPWAQFANAGTGAIKNPTSDELVGSSEGNYAEG